MWAGKILEMPTVKLNTTTNYSYQTCSSINTSSEQQLTKQTNNSDSSYTSATILDTTEVNRKAHSHQLLLYLQWHTSRKAA